MIDELTDSGADDAPQLTRTERRRLRTHAALLNATLDLMIEQQTTSISSSGIADAADVAVGTFYNHFPSTADAVREALLPLRDLFGDIARTVRENPHDPESLGGAMALALYHLETFPTLWRAAAVAPLDSATFRDEFGDGDPDLLDRQMLATRLLVMLAREYLDPVATTQQPRQWYRILASAMLDDPGDIERSITVAVDEHLALRAG